MDAPEGWDVRNQAGDIIVAVIDTGIRYTHEDLSANLWSNPLEVPGNGLDDDHDGYVDDVHGINVIAGSGDPNDDNGHGTHVAGIIGAVGNNGRGVVGVAWRVQLMACKFINASGYGWVSDAITCINYARTHGASVMNNSWGGSSYSQGLKDAIDAAGAAGIIFVAAAGNSSSDNDGWTFYPAGYTSENLVSVAATTRTDDLAYFSNFGQESVDLGAPGMDITSTWNTSDSAYTSLSGTSMAAPEVSGVFALMKAQFPTESCLQLFNRVYGTTDPLIALRNKCRTGGRINLARALNAASSRPGNDDFANRLPLARAAFTLNGINVDATKEPGEPDHAGEPGGKSIWWSWRPPAPGIATVTTEGSTFATVLAVYTGSSVSNLTQVASAPAWGGGSVTFDVVSGKEYSIAVDGVGGASGSVVLNVALLARPANDNFADRIAITGSVATVTGSNNWATSEAGEPVHAGQAGGTSVWWSWTPVSSEPAIITSAGSDFNTLLAVYTGTSVSNLSLVASNDDDPAGGTTSRVTFNGTAGATYQIAVDGYDGATGNIVLNTPPLNDHFANRIALVGSSALAIGFNGLATKDALEPNHAGKAGGKSLWWTWTAPSSGTATATTIGSTFDTVLAVYTGSSLAALSPVASNDNDPYGNFTSLVSFSAVAGTTYQIAVDGVSEAAGKVIVQVIMGSQYMITDIAPPAGYNNTCAYAVNNYGAVAGAFMTDAPQYTSHACIWTSSGGVQPLISGDTSSFARDINDFNQVVGYLSRPGYGSIAFLWQNGVVRELGGLDPFPFSGAYAIDNAGRVAGWSSKNGSIHAFLWQDGVMSDLGAIGTDRTAAYGMNGQNYVVGSGSRYDASGQWPILWQTGGLVNLPLPVGANEGCALAVNSLFQVVGHYNDGYAVFHSLLWQDGVVTDIGAPPGPDGSTADSINNLGQVVGSDGSYNTALLWSGGQWTSLANLVPAGSGWTSLFAADKINDQGQIAGSGLRNGYTRGFVMTPLTPVTPLAIITAPTNQQTFFEGEDVTLNLWLVPNATNVAKVDCFACGNPIGVVTNLPYAVTWHGVPAGQYVLSARTTTPSGATATSKTVSISVLPRPRVNFVWAAGQLALAWPTSYVGFQLESATNLQLPVLWQPVTDPTLVFDGSNTTTAAMTNHQGFFRLRRP